MEQGLTKEGILERMRDPGSLVPREVMEFYAYLSATFADIHITASELKAAMAGEMARHVSEGESAAKAKMLVEGSLQGQSYIKCVGELTGLEEAIRALKKAQQYYTEEARNQW